ncbi:MAG: arginine--tRNA ligase [Verrucomicrobiota bacterium]
MPTFSHQLNDRLRSAVEKAATGKGLQLPPEVSIFVSSAKDPRFGDYQSNAAMMLGTRLKMNPREFAGEVIRSFEGGGLVEPPEIAGPGFINFRISTDALAARFSEVAASERLGVEPAEKPDTIVIDFSAPNVAKPMHVGHIRGTIIGDCLGRVARYLGHHVITDNHIGDWGTQFGMIIHGWKSFLDEAALAADPLAELLRIYRKVNSSQKEDESLREICKAELVKLQGGNEENLEIWRQCVGLSIDGLNLIYERLDIRFDHWLGESYYNDALAPLVEELLREGIAQESDGAIGIFSDGSLEPKEDPFLVQKDGQWTALPCLIRKSDGGFLYATTDLATIDYRIREFTADRIWYVVGAPQQSHFDQVFAVARRRGVDADLRFVSFGSILGKDRKMLRTRDGETVQLGGVLEEAVDRALAVVEEKNPELPADEKKRIAEMIGIGAVKYSELSQHRMTDYIFDWDKMLSLQGNTAPYLQNAAVRIQAIFRKSGEDADPSVATTLRIGSDGERRLALVLCSFAEILPEVLHDFRPNLLANYLFDLAKAFHGFYESCPVLSSEGEVKASRLALCAMTLRVFEQGLGLMGIKVPARM